MQTTGHIFERRLIEKYLEQHGKCPVTQQDLSKQDLLPIQSSADKVLSIHHQI